MGFGLLEHFLYVLHLATPLVGGQLANLAQILVRSRVHLLQNVLVLAVQVVHQGKVSPHLTRKALQRVQKVLQVRGSRHD